MAVDDTKGKKRKGASDAAPNAKKAKKSDGAAAPTKPAKSPKVAKATPVPVESKAPKTKVARKQAADFMSEDEVPAAEATKPTKGKKKAKVTVEVNGDEAESIAVKIDVPVAQDKPKKGKKVKVVEVEVQEALAPEPEAPKEKTKKTKKSKAGDPAPAEEAVAAEVEVPSKKSKKAKANKTQEEEPEEVDNDVTMASEVADDDAEVDDQTAALLAGFESDEDDDTDPEDDLEFDEDAPVPTLNRKARKAAERAAFTARNNQPGVVYVSRVPRGFFEPQMKKYFSQFGRVNRLRLSRNKKTGASKHYAFVEFASTEVADIVARTMDNYLLFGHILKCKLIPEDQVHPDLFKGAGQRFKVDPKNKKAGLEMARGVERAQWEKRVANENQRRSGRNKQLKEDFGYEFKAPTLKAVADVPKQATGLENGEPQELLAEAPVEETPAIEQPKAKKGKKAAKVQEEAAPAEAVPAQPAPEKTTKKDKKRKSDVVAEEIIAAEEVAPVESTPKSKKAKKSAKPEPIVEETPAVPVEEKKTKAAAAKPKKAKKAKA